jgi:hypothetical protein
MLMLIEVEGYVFRGAGAAQQWVFHKFWDWDWAGLGWIRGEGWVWFVMMLGGGG